MKTKIYSHHHYEIDVIDDEKLPNLFEFAAKPKGIEFIFHNENCFSVKNTNGEYLTAFPDKIVKFYAKKCSTWEKFYILDIEAQIFIEKAINNHFKDRRGNEIKNFELFFEKDKLSVMLGTTIITPSYIPSATLEYLDNGRIKYKTLKKCTILNQKRKLVYFCIYGKPEYYECFYLALKSLIKFGGYTDDILIKTDNIEYCQEITKEFTNIFHFSKIDENLGIFNRYSLHEDILNNYDSIIYLDCDVLTINNINTFLNKCCEQADFLSYIEADNKTYSKDYAHKYTWWGADFLKYNQEIDTQNYFMYNSGFFIINNLQTVKPIFDRVISYRQFSTHTGDQPFLNLALYNSRLDILGINKNDGLSFSRSMTQSFDALNQIWVHFNSGVGNLSKLNLMKSFYTKLTH